MLGTIGGILVIVGTTIKAIDDLTNNKQGSGNMKAYEIKNAMIDTLDIFLESNQDEMDKESYDDVMEYLREELENKSSNIVRYIRNLELENVVAKTEIDRLEELKKGREKKINSLKGYIKEILLELDKKKIETDLGNISLRRTTSVEIIDISKIPKEYLIVKEEVTASKKLIGDSLKKNIVVSGALLKEDYSLLMK